MTVTYRVSNDGKFVYAKAMGVLLLQEIFDYLRNLAEDERIMSGYRVLFDMTGLSKTLVTPDSFDRILELIVANPKRSSSTKMAIVAGPEPVSFENAKRIEQMINPDKGNIVIFNDIETARTWLGVSDDET